MKRYRIEVRSRLTGATVLKECADGGAVTRFLNRYSEKYALTSKSGNADSVNPYRTWVVDAHEGCEVKVADVSDWLLREATDWDYRPELVGA